MDNIRLEINGIVYEGELRQVNKLPTPMPEVAGPTSNVEPVTIGQPKPQADTVDVMGDVGEPLPTPAPAMRGVVRSPKTGDKVYLVDRNNNTKKWVKSPEELESLGFGFSDVTDITDDELAKFRLVLS